MLRGLCCPFLTFAAVVVTATVQTIAFAAPKDAAATKIDQDAMNNDYLNVEFAKAEANLKKALDVCGASGCSADVKARIYVHLGIVQANNNNSAMAEDSFVKALETSPNASLDPDFTTQEISLIFDSARARVGSGAQPAEQSDDETSSTSEILHEPIVEQMVNTPVPIWVQLPQTMEASKVIVRYRPFGGSWKKQYLRQQKSGWSANIDCNEITTTGALKYYITVLDKSGEPITSVGSLDKPFVTQIKNQLDGPPPHLPNEPPPARCAAKEDCPPGLPGCPGSDGRGNKGWGSACEATRECETGLICLNGLCEEGEETTDKSKASPSQKVIRNWFGLTGQMDLAIVSGTDVCGRDSQNNKGYACFTQESPPQEDVNSNKRVAAGTHYHGNPIAKNNGNAIKGGLALSTIRILVNYDRVIGENFTLGLHAGWAFRGGPKPDGGRAFLPLHAEARGGYWFGNSPFSKKGVRGFVFVGGGMAQVDAKVPVAVTENGDESECPSSKSDPDYTKNYCVTDGTSYTYDIEGMESQTHPKTQKLDAWRKAGQGVAVIGGGLMYAFTPHVGVVLEAKANFFLPTFNFVISPTLGMRFGF